MPTRLIKGTPESKTAKAVIQSPPLWQRVSELGASSALILFLSEMGSDRLSLTQAAFFMLAAAAEARGQPATRSEIIQTYPDNFRGSIRNSYRQLMEPSRNYPKALGWLAAELNPMDSRERVLRLTFKGRQVVEGALITLQPLTETPTAN